MAITRDDPHADTPMLRRGPEPASARSTAILIHGRGASAEDILGLSSDLDLDDVAWLAPQAAGSTWYPQSFLAPIADNEPFLSSALKRVGAIVAMLGHQHVPLERIAIIGFSQGACLALEFAARHPARYAALGAFSGGLIGPPDTPRTYPGHFAGTPVFLGCSDIDPHIPIGRVRESAEVFRRMEATVDERIYRGMGHAINGDEIDAVRARLAAVPPRAPGR